MEKASKGVIAPSSSDREEPKAFVLRVEAPIFVPKATPVVKNADPRRRTSKKSRSFRRRRVKSKPVDHFPKLSASLPKDNNSAQSILWSAFPKQHQEIVEDEPTVFWQTGLDPLLPSGNRVVRKRLEFSAWDEESTHDTKAEESDLPPTILPDAENGLRKRTVDMTRLRDRWWMAVANQRRKQQELKRNEPKEEEGETEDVEAEEAMEYVDTRWNYGESDGIHRNTELDHQPTKDDPKSPDDLPKDVQKNAIPYNTTQSTRDLLTCMIEQNDDRALTAILAAHPTSMANPLHDESRDDLLEHAIDTAILRNKPHVLRTILSITKGTIPINSKPLLQAAKLNREECASILFSKQDRDATLLFQNEEGNTALHYCCRSSGDKDMVVLLLKQVAGNTKAKRQQLLKLVTATNQKKQTPLHIACEYGRNDLVEVFLTTCKGSSLFKLLSMEDLKRQTPLLTAVASNAHDVVLTLLMWRGNHDSRKRNDEFVESKTQQHPKRPQAICPMVWAAKDANLDMMDLLIQFGDPSGNSFHVTEALLMLLQSDASSEIQQKGSVSLVLVGANPFAETLLSFSPNGQKHETALSVAAKTGHDDVLRSIVFTAMKVRRDRQLARRRDPILRQQPESFFQALDLKENSEAQNALAQALLETLFNAYSTQTNKDFSTAITLYDQIDVLDESHLRRLQASLLRGTLQTGAPETKSWCLLATYKHSVTSSDVCKLTNKNSFDYDRSIFAAKSLDLLRMPWVQTEVRDTKCTCPWMKRTARESTQLPLRRCREVILVTEERSEFMVDAAIASEKSGKIASAFRFARMNQDGDDAVVRLDVSIPADFCKLLIQHMYHGSICFGWPNRSEKDMCSYLLELMVVAEEFIMPSLVQEIEMRFMSSKPKSCVCWNCCKALRVVSSENGVQEAECLYAVDGKSAWVQQHNVTDVLGVTDYLRGLDYRICVAPFAMNVCLEPKSLWKNYDIGLANKNGNHRWRVNTASKCLREYAVIIAMRYFASVVNNPDFVLSTEEVLDEQYQKQLLLGMCLDELKTNSILAASYSVVFDAYQRNVASFNHLKLS